MAVFSAISCLIVSLMLITCWGFGVWDLVVRGRQGMWKYCACRFNGYKHLVNIFFITTAVFVFLITIIENLKKGVVKL